MSDIKLTVRRKGNCGQYALCDESGNILPNQVSLTLESNTNAPSHLTAKFVIIGPAITFVEDMVQDSEKAVEDA